MAHNYPYIRAWGKYMGSYPYYINDQIAKAVEDNAPHDAIYERTDANFKREGWARFSELPEHKQKEIKKHAAQFGINIDLIPQNQEGRRG